MERINHYEAAYEAYKNGEDNAWLIDSKWLYHYYVRAKELGLRYIDFYDCSWGFDENFDEVAKALEDHAVGTITVSDGYSNVAKRIQKLVEIGYTIQGITTIKTGSWSDDYKAAFILKWTYQED